MTRLMVFAGLFLGLICFSEWAAAQENKPRFRILALAEKGGGVHAPFVAAARKWLEQEAKEQQFTIDYIENTDAINVAFLDRYQVFIQLNYPPHNWTDTAEATFTRSIESGKIGRIGFHHASIRASLMGSLCGPGSRISWAAFVTRTTSRLFQRQRSGLTPGSTPA